MDKQPIQLVDLADLVGRAEIAERAGIRLQTVDTWRRRYPSFPDPMGTISGTPIWHWPAVEAWIRDTPRDAGRPPRRPRNVPFTPLPERLRRAIRRDEPDEPIEEAAGSA
jgi:hypothetical protein